MLKNRFLGILVASACAGLAIGSVVAAPLGGGIAHAQGEAQAASLIPDAVIAEFNAAVSSTDMAQRVAGGKAAIAAAIAHPTDPNAATLVFEGGFLLCRSGACPEAQVAVDFLNGPAAGGWPAEEVQGLAALVGRSKKDTRASRKALGEAAEVVLGAEPSLLSIRVLMERVDDLVGEGDLAAAEDITRRAAQHLEGVASAEAIRWDFRLANLAAGFNSSPGLNWLETAYRLERELENIEIDANSSEDHWSEARFWRAHALRLTIASWLFSSDRLKPIQEREIVERLDADIPLLPRAVTEPEVGRLPACKFEYVGAPKPVFPTADLKKGRVGAVIVRFKVDEGAVKEPEVLAAIPDGRFGQVALDAIKRTKFKRTGKEPDGSCVFKRSDVVVPFVFQFVESGGEGLLR